MLSPMISSIILIAVAIVGIITIVVPRTLHMKTEWIILGLSLGLMGIGILTQ